MTGAGTRRLVILHQFDPEGSVAPYILAHLAGLRPLATRLVLVSNSPIDVAGRATAGGLCDRVVERANIGWDFAGWRDVLLAEDLAAYDAVILTNSSVVGPLYPLRPIVEKMEAGGSDFWGMVLSLHRGAHLQSYFLAFNAPVIRSSVWRQFWTGVEDLADKGEVIRRYETGLTRTLREAGFREGVLMPNQRFPLSLRMVHIARLESRLRVPFSVNYVNRTVAQHDELIFNGFPYLKASLLWGKDTYRLRNFDRIRALTADHFDWSEIAPELRR